MSSSIVTASFADLVKNKASVLSGAISRIVQPKFQGLNNPENYISQMKALANLKRAPFPRQARLIAASSEHLKNNDNLIISAEMGTGKTISGISIAYLITLACQGFKKNPIKPFKTFIMCPSHLVSKWAAEIEVTLGKKDKAVIPYQIVIVKRWDDLAGYHLRTLENKTYFFILSKETAKLSYPKRAAFTIRKAIVVDERGNKSLSYQFCCPDCRQVHDEARHSKWEPSIPRICDCGSVLRQVDKSKPSNTRLSVAEYIKKQFPKGWIDLLFLDELHELKGGDTGQGNAFGAIASMSKKCVGLTGTLLNGYASSLFYILYRMNPKLMKETLKLDYRDVERFVELYGAREMVQEAKEINEEGIVTKKGKKISVRELPRISPYLLTLLLPFTIFLRLDEMNIELPDYEESVELVEPDKEWLGEYQKYLKELASEVRENRRVLGALANDAISICDLPFMEFAPQTSDNNTCYTPPVTEDFVTAKEKRLTKLVRDELSDGRKCLVFATYTNLGVSKRLETLLGDALQGYSIKCLPSSVEASKREKWIKDNPCDVLICNPELVKTGLDLLEYPTIIFYQTTYNVFTLKQAARRSWRIGQDKNVKVIFMTYDKTSQRKALSLISRKVAAANSLEGRLSLGGDLAGLEEESTSLQMQLAKAIAQGGNSDKDNIETTKWSFVPREWDAFESLYINLQQEAREKGEISVERNVDEPLVLKPIVVPPVTKVKKIPKLDEDEKITVYKRVRKGKNYVDEAIDLTRAEIQILIQDNGPIQLSLF